MSGTQVSSVTLVGLLLGLFAFGPTGMAQEPGVLESSSCSGAQYFGYAYYSLGGLVRDPPVSVSDYPKVATLICGTDDPTDPIDWVCDHVSTGGVHVHVTQLKNGGWNIAGEWKGVPLYGSDIIGPAGGNSCPHFCAYAAAPLGALRLCAFEGTGPLLPDVPDSDP